MSAVVLPAAIADFTSTQVIFSNSTRSVCARGAARADPAASIREAVPPAINISKECETEPMRMSFCFPQKHKLVAVLTENRQFHKFIIITIILPCQHDSEICPDGDRGKIICVAMPQKFQLERRYVNTFLKMLFYTHALRRFDKPAEERRRDNQERLAYSVKEAADLLGVDYFSVYRLIQRGKLRACRALRGKLLVPRTELLRLLKN